MTPLHLCREPRVDESVHVYLLTPDHRSSNVYSTWRRCPFNTRNRLPCQSKRFDTGLTPSRFSHTKRLFGPLEKKRSVTLNLEGETATAHPTSKPNTRTLTLLGPFLNANLSNLRDGFRVIAFFGRRVELASFSRHTQLS